MQNIKDINPRELAPGMLAKLIHGAQTTLSILDIKKGSVFHEHSHVHEQITYIVEGDFDMVIGGEKFHFTSGSVQVIPSNVPHSAVALTDCKVIDAFSPAREDYK